MLRDAQHEARKLLAARHFVDGVMARVAAASLGGVGQRPRRSRQPGGSGCRLRPVAADYGGWPLGKPTTVSCRIPRLGSCRCAWLHRALCRRGAQARRAACRCSRRTRLRRYSPSSAHNGGDRDRGVASRRPQYGCVRPTWTALASSSGGSAALSSVICRCSRPLTTLAPPIGVFRQYYAELFAAVAGGDVNAASQGQTAVCRLHRAEPGRQVGGRTCR